MYRPNPLAAPSINHRCFTAAIDLRW